MADRSNPEPMSREWHYHPDLPLRDPSIFNWPPDPRFLARWFGRNWLMLSERVMMVLLAVAVWWFLYPSMDDARVFAFGWIAQIWAINMGLMIVVAGGLHWYFYTRRGAGQGAEIRSARSGER